MYAGRAVLDICCHFPTSVVPFTPVMRDTPSPWPPASATTKLAPTVMQESTLSHNKFALCLQSLLRPTPACNRTFWWRCVVEWFYKKAVWGVVKSGEFEANMRCSKILRIRRKNPMKWVVSISRDYWVYLDITWESFKIWEFWGEFWGIETFHRSKFSRATGVREWKWVILFSENFEGMGMGMGMGNSKKLVAWAQFFFWNR